MVRKSASRSAGWVLSRIVAQGLEFVAWVLIARRLGTSAVGVLAVSVVVARMLGLIGDWGAAFRGSRDVVMAGRESALVVGLVRRRQQVSTALAIVMAMGAVVTGNAAVIPMGAAVLARGAGRDWIALGEGRRRDASLPLLIPGALICGGVLVTTTVVGAASAFAVGNLAGLALSVALNPVGSARTTGRVVIDGWYLLAGITDQILVTADTLLLAILRTSAEAGVYASVYRLPLAWIMVVGLCTTAAIPMAADALTRNPTALQAAHRRADAVALLGAVAVVPIAAAGFLVVGPLFGGDFETGRSALCVLFIATAATTASAPYRVLYVVLGSDRMVGFATTGGAFVNVVANLIVIGRWGMTGRGRRDAAHPGRDVRVLRLLVDPTATHRALPSATAHSRYLT